MPTTCVLNSGTLPPIAGTAVLKLNFVSFQSSPVDWVIKPK